MKHISILVTPHSNLASVDVPRRAFLGVNGILQQQGKPPIFKVELVGMKKQLKMENGMFTIHPDVQLKNLKKTDLIVIPAFDGDVHNELKHGRDFVPWILSQYKNGAEIASLCVGAFLLASTGLLNGKCCSTHWMSEHAFKKMFPDVELSTDKVITDEHGICTSGGALSSANLVLYLIEKYAGRDIAVHCSKMFQVDIDRFSQSPFIIFEGQKDHEDEQIKQAQDYIEKNYHEKINVEQLTSMLALSRRNLERRFKKATANTIVEYMQRVKVEAVKKYLETGRKTVNELMNEVGYNDTKSFRSLFKKHTGLSPVEYRNKYNKEAVVVG
jgi:transcriptional regulator GlxA family with amidase domain